MGRMFLPCAGLMSALMRAVFLTIYGDSSEIDKHARWDCVFLFEVKSGDVPAELRVLALGVKTLPCIDERIIVDHERLV